MLFKCTDCKKNYEKQFNEGFAKVFESTYRFCVEYVNIFCMILRKGICSNEYMNSWQEFHEKSPDEKEFSSNLNIEDIIDAEYETNMQKQYERRR